MRFERTEEICCDYDPFTKGVCSLGLMDWYINDGPNVQF